MRFIPTVYTVLFYHSATEICFNQNYLGFYDKNCWSSNDYKYLALLFVLCHFKSNLDLS